MKYCLSWLWLTRTNLFAMKLNILLFVLFQFIYTMINVNIMSVCQVRSIIISMFWVLSCWLKRPQRVYENWKLITSCTIVLFYINETNQMYFSFKHVRFTLWLPLYVLFAGLVIIHITCKRSALKKQTPSYAVHLFLLCCWCTCSFPVVPRATLNYTNAVLSLSLPPSVLANMTPKCILSMNQYSPCLTE